MNKNVLNSKKKTPAKILIVEDEMIVAKDMQETLKSRGYAVTAIVNSGRDAIKEVKKDQPDLILMDIVLKGKMDGTDTAMRIHDDFDIPVIFITAFANNGTLQRAKTARPYAYITKPFESSELYINIEIALYKHKIQEELRHSEEKLKILFEFAPDAYYLNDLKGTFLDGNKAAEKLTGYRREDLVGKNFLKLGLLPKQQIRKAIKLLAANVLGKATGPDEFTIQKKDGFSIPVEIRTHPVKIGNETLVLGIARDISDRKNAYRVREQLLHDMGERIKELTCMYGTIKSIQERNTIEEIFEDLVVIIPSGWQYPEITRTKICYKHKIFRTLPFRETRWKQTSPIIINGKKQGSVEVYYTKSRPKLDEGPFAKEERHLLDNITITLSKGIERMQMEKRVLQLASFPEQNPNPVIEIDLNGKISYMNPATKDRFPNIISEGPNNPLLKDIINVVETIKNHESDSFTREVEENNSTYEEKICYLPKSKLARIFAYEITQRKKIETNLRKQSLIDQLTGLYNRRGFHTFVEQQMDLANRTKKGFYILFADIDRMKWINDTFGHHEGDLALQTVAASCKNSFRKSDIIARLGGDEFVICAIEAKKDSVELLMKRLRKNLDIYNKERKHDHQLSLSIGTTYYDPSAPCSIQELLDRADELMYEQKMQKHIVPTMIAREKSIKASKRKQTELFLQSDIVRVLVIENSMGNKVLIQKMMSEVNTIKCSMAHAEDLKTGISRIEEGNIDVIILDLNLPDSKGYETFNRVKTFAPTIPIIIITGLDDENLAVNAIRDGAQDCLVKNHIDSNLLMRSIRYAVERNYTALELKNSFGKFLKVLEDTIHALASIVELRDPYTAGHQKRVSQLAEAMAKEMNLSGEQVKGIKMAALIHDVGKTQVPEDILNKTTKLSKKEMKIVKTHTRSGYEILKTIKFPWLITQIVHQHHERVNGSGYPKGIHGKDILLESKILAVADVIEAMSSDRPYRPALSIKKALDEITQNKGKLYDPDVVDTCIKLFKNKDFKFATGVKS